MVASLYAQGGCGASMRVYNIDPGSLCRSGPALLLEAGPEAPTQYSGIDDRPVVVGILADEPLLKGLSEFQILLIQRGELIFSDNRGQALASPTLA